MSRPVAMRSSARRARTRGFTLIEVILTTVLAAVLLSALWTLLSMHVKLFDTGQTRTEQSQLARTLLKQIADDLHGVVQSPPPAPPVVAAVGLPMIPAPAVTTTTSSSSSSSSSSSGNSTNSAGSSSPSSNPPAASSPPPTAAPPVLPAGPGGVVPPPPGAPGGPPAMPQMAQMPQMPQLPTPQMKQMPQMPQLPTPQMKQMPQLPTPQMKQMPTYQPPGTPPGFSGATGGQSGGSSQSASQPASNQQNANNNASNQNNSNNNSSSAPPANQPPPAAPSVGAAQVVVTSSLRPAGLFGSDTQLQIDVRQSTSVRNESEIETRLPGEQPASAAAELKTITYSFEERREPNRPLGEPSMVLVRREVDWEEAHSTAPRDPRLGEPAGPLSGLPGTEDTEEAFERPTGIQHDHPPEVAPEVEQFGIRYFDGTVWTNEWDSVARKGLPVAVEVAMQLRAFEDQEQAPLAADTPADETAPKRPKLPIYRLVIHLPSATAVAGTSTRGARDVKPPLGAEFDGSRR